MLPIKKVYVDSKFKTKDSKSDSNFKFELPSTCLMPNNTVLYVDDFCIPHSWTTVNENNAGKIKLIKFILNVLSKR